MPIPSTSNNITRPSAKQQVYNTLKDWIVNGTLTPGEYIYDSEIAQHFSVSRTPVREAIQLLAQQDLVEIVPSRGTRVTDTSAEHAESSYEAIASLACAIIRLAIKKTRSGDIEELTRLNLIFAQAVQSGDHPLIMETDAAFHGYILKMADNSYLTACWQQLTPHIVRYESLYFRSGSDREESIQDHKEIIAAIETKDEQKGIYYSDKNWMGFFHNRLKPCLQS